MKTFEAVVDEAEHHLINAHLYYGHGMSSAYDEAVYAAVHCLGLHIEDEIDWDAGYSVSAYAKLNELIRKRCETHQPMAYLTHEAYLHGFKFYVDERVIVPRSFIGELILEEFSPWIDVDKVTDVLELCTGSGCLAIMAAEVFQLTHVDAIDIDEDALAVAGINVAQYELQERISLIQSDLYHAVPADKKYDIVFTNPPYVNSDSMSKLPKEYLAEPHISLAGGTDGMDLVRTIVAQAAQHLKPHGILVVEIGNEFKYAEAAFKKLPLTWLETSGAENAVFLLTAKDLLKYA